MKLEDDDYIETIQFGNIPKKTAYNILALIIIIFIILGFVFMIRDVFFT